ncbi:MULTISPECIES: hypothetical protein [unclassified Halomonas]|uniref:hypothetical protein n=1 Tax=unclassified Halomonas TaxID=2609666 RepID=UPI00055084FC|nr:MULTISPECIES: hypothetical protein [unclassified Halomonas]CEP37598.1 Putative uncharacterized protein [Halomonas sp. R57-5]
MRNNSKEIAERFADKYNSLNAYQKSEFKRKIYGDSGDEISIEFILKALDAIDKYKFAANENAPDEKVNDKVDELSKMLISLFKTTDEDKGSQSCSNLLFGIYEILSFMELSLAELDADSVAKIKNEYYFHIIKKTEGSEAILAVRKIEEWKSQYLLKEVKEYFLNKMYSEIDKEVESSIGDKAARINELEVKLDKIERKSTILNDKENLGKLAESFDNFKEELNNKLGNVKALKWIIQILTLACPLVSVYLVYLILFDESVLIELRYYIGLLFPFTALTILFIYFFRLTQSEENKLKSMIWGLDNKISIINYYSAMKIVNDGKEIDPELDKAIQMAIIRPVEHVSIENINVYDGLAAVLEPISKMAGRNKPGS